MINKVFVKGNELNNTGLYALNVDDMVIIENKITNSNISIYASNCLLDRNELKNLNDSFSWAIRFWVEDFYKDSYDVYIGDNEIQGEYRNIESIIDTEKVIVHRENLEEYMEKFENK